MRPDTATHRRLSWWPVKKRLPEGEGMRKTIVHLLQGVHNEVDWRVQNLIDGRLANKPVIELRPLTDPVGEPLVVDNDEQIEFRVIDSGRVRFMKSSSSRVTAIKDDLLDPFLLLPFMLGERLGNVELFEDDRHKALQFALLVGRKMFKIGFHRAF